MKIVALIILISAMGAFWKGKLLKNIFGKKNDFTMASEATHHKGSFYDFKVNDLSGNPVNLNDYKGKKVVIINVASKCGFTPQYANWEEFYEKHKDKIVVLGFPANNFMSQEPGSNSEIAEFCQKNYGVTFKMFEKVSVAGKDKHPLYQWLSSKELNGWNDREPSWNFCKYVINENGNLTHFFESKITPDKPEFLKAVGL